MNSPAPFPESRSMAPTAAVGAPRSRIADEIRRAAKSAVVFLAVAPVAFGAPPSPASATAAPAISREALSKLFVMVGSDYKKAQELPDTFFNPFKVEATTDITQQKKGITIDEQSVAEAVGRRGVSGILYAADPASNQVIIGDQVFRVGEELDFPGANDSAAAPLLLGATVVLREVGEKGIVFEFIAEGEAARRSTYSLRSFWRP